MTLDVPVFREALRRERDALQARLRYVDMTLEGLDGLDATRAAPAVASTPVLDEPSPDGREVERPVRVRRGLSARLARQSIVAARRLTPDELAEQMIARGWETPAQDRTAAARAAGNRVKDVDANIFFEDGAFVYRPASTPPAPQGAGGGVNVEALR